ncbi:MAG TPA: FHA domain-containing serine/threonine-protein kinase [Thermoleophilaceae bacterium]|nr:FHA domain-containing serine/threonine-protein kinase [Thermoleophilaceae bacterium]
MAGEQLQVTEGKERGKRVIVDTDLLIGRAAPEEDGRLGDDPEISRRHARVSRGPDGELTIEDLRSANGTFVNDERIAGPRRLHPGDVVRMGQTILQVTDVSSSATHQVPQPAGAPAAEPPEAAQELLVTAGAAPGRRLALTDEFVIGRAVEGEGRLGDDRELSRRHARVSRDASGRLTIEDLGSANGTFVNGERVRERQPLKVGDSIRVGRTTLQLTDVAQAPAPPASVPAPPASVPPSPPPAPASAPPTPEDVEIAARREDLPTELPLGAVFAGCRVEEVIGRGDMGVVYGAEELALQRRVALKLILPEHSAEERYRKRFQRESLVAAAIDHPNVIPILDAGDEDGVLYITMRLVEGTDLRTLISEQGRLDPLRGARIVRQVGAALDAAHARGLLHRDVKPPNVLLAREDHVYLSDFGLAKRADEEGGMTRQGSIVARAEYVAPEQILNERVDALADIYALGCLLYEALTGEAPFARWKEGPAELAHLNAPRPSPRELSPDLPREFDEVVHRAMAQEPSERYPSAGDLGEAALVAAGGLRKASPWSVVATGEAAPPAPGAEPPEAVRAASAVPYGVEPPSSPHEPASNGHADAGGIGRPDTLRWAIALGFLAIVFVGMIAALGAISSL